MFHTNSADNFIIYLHTQLHNPSYDSSSIIAMKWRGKMQHYCHIVILCSMKKILHIFQRPPFKYIKNFQFHNPTLNNTNIAPITGHMTTMSVLLVVGN
jgi:hypothetical protein